MPVEHYDALIIGAGQAGVPLGPALAGAGRRVLTIERKFAGGTCINDGCTPTKTMVASGRMAYLARRAAEYGINVGPVSVDMRQVRQRKRKMVRDFRASTERRILRVTGSDLMYGEAFFTGPNSVEVKPKDGGALRQLEAELIFINTGARPALPPLPGIDRVTVYNSTTIMEMDEAPEHLIVLGGGYIGLEFAQLFRRLGAEVTVVQRSGHVLSREDEDVAEAVTAILHEDGVEILLNTTSQSVSQDKTGAISLQLRTESGTQTLAGTHLLTAVGRTPNTEDLNLSAAGVKVGRGGFITVNERLETNVPGIYAVGDVNGGPAFTHISYDDFRVIRDNLLLGKPTTTNRLAPYVVFIDPQLGRVGLTENEARERGLKYRVAKMPMESISRAWEMGETRGLIKAIVDAKTGQILGAAVLGVEGGELMATLQVAMLGKLHFEVLREAIFAHPTLSEGINTLFTQFQDQAV
jgi:pyruvate/2-oxoglutarate dehydrogenase complex dihydrolipoamide dehydrogenase (E3) component